MNRTTAAHRAGLRSRTLAAVLAGLVAACGGGAEQRGVVREVVHEVVHEVAREVTREVTLAPPRATLAQVLPVVALAGATASPGGPVAPLRAAPLIGVNIHAGGGTPAANQKLADVMARRGLASARMDLTPDADRANFRDQVQRLKALGIRTEVSLQTSYQWRHDCPQALAEVEQDAHDQTVAMLKDITDLVHDFELLNEVHLRKDTAAQVPPYRGTPAAGYAGAPCYRTFAAVLRGMSRAIVAQRAASGLPLKIILGTVSNDFGFLEFMQQQGVVFDIVGYHTYPRVEQALLGDDPWYGPGGALVQLARFKRPVRINEFNCGEIYTAAYDNRSGSRATQACLVSIQKHLRSLMAQTVIDLQSIHAYELTDRPEQPVPENRFGLMVDLDTPKLHLALIAAFAGGAVSVAERLQLNALGLTGRTPVVGVNIHAGGSTAADRQQLAEVMAQRQLASARMDFTPDADRPAFRDQVQRLQALGIRVEASLQTSYQWRHDCPQALAEVEQDAHAQTVAMVQDIVDLVRDFELLNEVSLRPDTAAQVPPYAGTPAAGYAEASCYRTLSAVLRGMSRAIAAQRLASGLPLKIVLGAVSNDFGFLEFMQQQEVVFDVVGYHAYPRLAHALLNDDPWYGEGGALAQLARFGLPVRINAFNCGEIQAPGYDDTLPPGPGAGAAGSGSDDAAACLASVNKHLAHLLAQTVVPLEVVHAYELTDRPAEPPPGNRVGLMFDLDRPKLLLAMFAAHAGGFVSAAERLLLDALGFVWPQSTSAEDPAPSAALSRRR